MNSQDRELFEALTRRHAQLENSVALLKTDLDYLRAQLGAATETPSVPPLPVFHSTPVEPPPLPVTPPPVPQPLPTFAAAPPPVPTREVEEEKPAVPFEINYGRWLARVGAVMAVILLISISQYVYNNFHQYIGPWTRLTAMTLVSLGLIATGFWMERKKDNMLVYARTLAGGGLACLYYTLYGATYVEPIHVNPSPIFGGMLLLAWSAAVLYLAEKRKSELLSIFAIALAYFSSTITPAAGAFSMAANLLLAATAVTFLVRNAWTGLSYLCLICTYAGFVRQIVEHTGPLPFEFRLLPVVAFWPLAIYLAGAWIIFTAGIFFARPESFRDEKRMAFLCLNNGAMAGLLVFASQLSHFGHLGGILGASGAALLAAYGLAVATRNAETDIAAAYLMQGLALGTGGIVAAFTGVTRGLLITVESVFLAASGAYSRNLIFRIGGAIAALLGTVYLLIEIGLGTSPYPWVLTFGGALAMLANACLARREQWHDTAATARVVVSAGFYTLLSLALIGFGICLHAPDDWVPVDLAIAALVLTFSIYAVPLFELPLLSQLLLIVAQIAAFSAPLIGDNPNSWAPDWSRDLVAVATMVLVTWWPRQGRVRTAVWLQPLLVLYALAMVAFAYSAVHPLVTAQTWMIAASALSLVFLAYGIWARVWQFALAGQIFLALSVATFLDPTFHNSVFGWTWWAAAVPPVTIFFTGWLARSWLPAQVKADATNAQALGWIGRIYQSIAVALFIRWIFGVVPDAEQTLAFFGVATALMLVNTRWASSYGIRTAFVLDLVGCLTYLTTAAVGTNHPFTTPDAIGFALFLAQPAILRRWGQTLVSIFESWVVILVAAGMSWLFVSNSVLALHTNNLTLAWALFALALTGIGFLANERRQRWCGLAILGAAMVRAAFVDFWQLSDLYKILTFFALTVICLGLSYLYYKFGDKLKEWL